MSSGEGGLGSFVNIVRTGCPRGRGDEDDVRGKILTTSSVPPRTVLPCLYSAHRRGKQHKKRRRSPCGGGGLRPDGGDPGGAVVVSLRRVRLHDAGVWGAIRPSDSVGIVGGEQELAERWVVVVRGGRWRTARRGLVHEVGVFALACELAEVRAGGGPGVVGGLATGAVR